LSFYALSLPAVALLLFSSNVLLLSRDWRWSIAALGPQYLGVFLLIAASWPAELAVIKLVTGWMAGAILGLTLIGAQQGVERYRPRLSERVFRLLAASLIVLVVFSLTTEAGQWIPGIRPNQLWGGLLLIGMGLLHLGLTIHPLRVLLSLLTVLSGFEIVYAAVEASTLVTGLLAVVTLAIALVGAYLLTVTEIEVPW